jgi:hypothetical protein
VTGRAGIGPGWFALAVLLGACASKPAVSPDAQACLKEAPPAKHSYDYTRQLTSLKTRAAFFGSCMETRGYTLDEDKLQDALLHSEQVKNADWLGGDPQNALRLREQELRASPEYWRKAPAGG